jgi:hypothetical protein
MTFHRWRKLPIIVKAKAQPSAVLPEVASTPAPRSMAEMARVLEELAIENRRLRKIVTDLLLEKMKVEESAAVISPIVSPKKNVANV